MAAGAAGRRPWVEGPGRACKQTGALLIALECVSLAASAATGAPASGPFAFVGHSPAASKGLLRGAHCRLNAATAAITCAPGPPAAPSVLGKSSFLSEKLAVLRGAAGVIGGSLRLKEPRGAGLNRGTQLGEQQEQSGLLGSSMVKTLVTENDFEFDRNEAGASIIRPFPAATSAATPFKTSESPDRTKDVSEMEAKMAEAKEAEKNRDLPTAIVLLDELCNDFPENGKIWMRRFKIARRQRRYREAREILNEALKHIPGNAILWQAWADLEKSLGRHVVARKLFKKGKEANPHLPSIYNSWGAMERSLGDIRTARRLFKEGLKQNPESPRLLLSLGILEDTQGSTEYAKTLLSKGLSIEPANPHLHHAMAVLEFKRGNSRTARESLRRAVGVDAGYTNAWLAWGQLEESEGNIEMACEKYREGTKARNGKGTVQLWQAWARLEEKRENGRLALNLYSKATKLFPDDVHLLLEQSKLHEKRGEIAMAFSTMEKALAVAKYDPYVYQCLGLLHARQHHYGKSREVFAKGIEMATKGRSNLVRKGEIVGKIGDREIANLMGTWAILEDKRGNIEEARDLFLRAVAQDGRQAWLWRLVADFEARNGDFLVARHYYARAVNANGSDGATWSAWGHFELNNGDEERGQFYLNRGAELESLRTIRAGKKDAERPLARPWVRE